MFGPAKKFLSDNGGKFCNNEFISLCESFNIRICMTAAESLWSNGLVERHNAILGLIVTKIVDDLDCDLDIAVSWGISVKNSLKNVNRFSPNQLMFGRNPNFPNVMDNKLPALESVSCSDTVITNLEVMHQAREEFIKNKASSKLRKALKSQVRTHNDVRFETGDLVYYKRRKGPWKGPGSVIGQDGQQVLIKHSSSYRQVHPCNVKHRENNTISAKDIVSNTHAGSTTKSAEREGEINLDKLPVANCVNNRNDENQVNTSEINIPDSLVEYDDSNELESQNEEIVNNIDSNHVPAEDEAVIGTEDLGYLNNHSVPKKNNFVEVITKGSDEIKHVQIISRAGKGTGQYAKWYNSMNIENGEISQINWEDVDKWKHVDRECMYVCIYLPVKIKIQ